MIECVYASPYFARLAALRDRPRVAIRAKSVALSGAAVKSSYIVGAGIVFIKGC